MTSTYQHYLKWPHALPQEVAVAIEINGLSYAVMMASPVDLDDFVLGFLFTERVIDALIDVHDIEVVSSEKGYTMQVTLANRCMSRLQDKRRYLRGNSGCGICGVVALEQVFGELPILPQQDTFPYALPTNLKQQCCALQQQRKTETKQDSEAVHAAFWLEANSSIRLCREDIGRHNAVDKLIGALLKKQRNNASSINKGALIVTSRCSVELVQKAIVAQIATLISFASPSSLAVELAFAHNLQLIHIPKNDTPILYSPDSFSSEHYFQENTEHEPKKQT